MTTIPEIVATNIKKRRQELGWTQAQLAEYLELHPTFVGSIERGVKFPSTVTLEKICEVMRVRPYALFLEEGVDDVPDNSEATIAKFSIMLMKDLPSLIKERVRKNQEDFFKNR